MGQDKSRWFSSKQLDYLNDPQSVDSKHRSTVHDRLEERVNEEIIPDLQRIPKVVDFLTPATRESLQLQDDAAYISKGLAEIYSDQASDLIFGVLLSEKDPEESTDEFLDRFDEVWADIEKEVRNQIHTARLSHGVRQTFRRLQRDLLEHLLAHIDATREWSAVKIRVPTDEVVRWIVDQGEIEGSELLPDILDAAYGIRTDESIPKRCSRYWSLLSKTAEKQGVEPPHGEGWPFDFVDPFEADYERHEAALSALDEGLRTALHQFWERKQVLELDQLLALGLVSCTQLQSHDMEVLNRIPSSNLKHDGWTGYDTRRANALVDNRSPPILSRDVITKPGTDEKKYQFTDYGRFVYWLSQYVDQKGTIPAVQRDFVADAPDGVVDNANEWLTSNLPGARRLDLSVEELKSEPEGSDRERDEPVLSNSVLWIEVIKQTDESMWDNT